MLLATSQLKNPAIVFWIGAVLFGYYGVGRFMIGDHLQGVLKMILLLVTIFFLIPVALSSPEDPGVFFVFLFIICLLASYIWWFIDLFLIGKKLRQKNYQTLLDLLHSLIDQLKAPAQAESQPQSGAAK